MCLVQFNPVLLAYSLNLRSSDGRTSFEHTFRTADLNSSLRDLLHSAPSLRLRQVDEFQRDLWRYRYRGAADAGLRRRSCREALCPQGLRERRHEESRERIAPYRTPQKLPEAAPRHCARHGGWEFVVRLYCASRPRS